MSFQVGISSLVGAVFSGAKKKKKTLWPLFMDGVQLVATGSTGCNFVPLSELWVQTKNKLTLRPWPLLIVKPHNWSSFQEHQDETYPQETWREFHRPPHLSPHLHHKRNYQAKRIKKNDFKSKLSNVQAWTNCAPDFLRAYILPHKKRKTLSICKFSVA